MNKLLFYCSETLFYIANLIIEIDKEAYKRLLLRFIISEIDYEQISKLY